jgi:hypothetical protein
VIDRGSIVRDTIVVVMTASRIGTIRARSAPSSGQRPRWGLASSSPARPPHPRLRRRPMRPQGLTHDQAWLQIRTQLHADGVDAPDGICVPR